MNGWVRRPGQERLRGSVCERRQRAASRLPPPPRCLRAACKLPARCRAAHALAADLFPPRLGLPGPSPGPRPASAGLGLGAGPAGRPARCLRLVTNVPRYCAGCAGRRPLGRPGRTALLATPTRSSSASVTQIAPCEPPSPSIRSLVNHFIPAVGKKMGGGAACAAGEDVFQCAENQAGLKKSLTHFMLPVLYSAKDSLA